MTLSSDDNATDDNSGVSDRRWRLIVNEPADGAWNMALDEALLESVIEGADPAFRLYAWDPPTVSLGYFQPLDDDIDEAEIVSRGFGLVRRPTGGRAILHADEITYSVSVRQSEIEGGDSLMGSYRTISRGIERGLNLIGVGAELAENSAKEDGGDDKSLPTVCFGKSARVDMVAAGRKIVGSAQTRRSGAILQHGSIPITIDPAEHLAVMPGGLEGSSDPETGDRMLQEAACGLAEIIGRRPDFEQLTQQLAEGFSEALQIGFEASEPTSGEQARAEELVEQKYGADAWTRKEGER